MRVNTSVNQACGSTPFIFAVTMMLYMAAARCPPRSGAGLVLLWKRLEQGAFRWPPISDGMMRLTASQLAALIDGMDWSRLYAHDVPRPTSPA